ncbi:hypothetical protein HGRIS_008840 [Hohenbuehelia grisea]|uniref:Uncharacterized protein n=1 Tax=Hohenbuehelia grisea TaxID=104357 RepID=A0ABR3IZA5_9AGAR
MIMVKNVYFSIAKAKIDTPKQKFWIILLGTDHLEILFGTLRTMVGNDTNVDAYQLGSRLTGTIEVSTILAKHPEWDRTPRRLKLPVLAKDGFDIHSNVDHINPASWRGDVRVSSVVLQTCWKLGHLMVKDYNAEFAGKLDKLSARSADLFSLCQKDPIRAKRDTDDIDDTLEHAALVPSVSPAVASEVEDAMALDEPRGKNPPFFEIGGRRISKAKYLGRAFEAFKKPGSRDHLKRVANDQRYTALLEGPSIPDVDVASDDAIIIHIPVIILVRCDKHYFVCVGEVQDIIFNGKHVQALSVDFASEESVVIAFQIIFSSPQQQATTLP